MGRLWLFIGVLLVGLSGCAGDGDKGAWGEFWKDVRGDNMKMRNDFPGVK